MENPTLSLVVLAILAVLVPPIVSALKSTSAPPWVNQAAALGVSLAAGLASVVIDAGGLDGFSLEMLLAHAAVVFALAQTVYRLYFADTPLNRTLENLVFGNSNAGPALAVLAGVLATAFAQRPDL